MIDIEALVYFEDYFLCTVTSTLHLTRVHVIHFRAICEYLAIHLQEHGSAMLSFMGRRNQRGSTARLRIVYIKLFKLYYS